MTDKSAKIILNGNEIELPIYESTLGQNVIDISQLLKNNHFTYDNGFVSTAACESKITYIDGKEGVLLYRGYPIAELAEKKNYLENCYLLLNGELPNEMQSAEFRERISRNMGIEPEVEKVLSAFSENSHPMASIMGMLSQMAALENDKMDLENTEYRLNVAERLIAHMPTYVAYAYRHRKGLSYIEPKPELEYATNFLSMLFSDNKPHLVDQTLAHALDKIFTLHADHEQNASTSAVRLVGSTQTNPYAAIAAGVGALWGPSHGGANEACLKMLQEIGDVKNIPEYIERAKDKDDPFRLMGFGHRVYKNYDPRAKIMRSTCHEVLKFIGENNDPLLKIAIELEKIALEDEYFVQKKLYPNVDFYSGITLSAIGIPTSLFTPIFALSRTVGWVSQWHEMLSLAYRIGRPRQWYTGPKLRHLED